MAHLAGAAGVTTRGEGRLHEMLHVDLKEEVLRYLTGKTGQREEEERHPAPNRRFLPLGREYFLTRSCDQTSLPRKVASS